MMTICVAMEAKNLEHRYSAKSRFFRTAKPPGASLELKGERVAIGRRSQPQIAQ
jgi:hypothetical protein